MSIQEILEAHTVKRPWSEASRMRCKCGEVVTAETEGQLYTLHRAHVADLLEQHMHEQYALKLEGLADDMLKMGAPAGPQQTSEWLADKARIARVMHMLQPLDDRFISSILDVALKVPGSRTLVLTPRASATVQEISSALDAAALGATYRVPDWEWTLDNGSKIQLGWLNGSEDTWRYGGAEFQLIAFDDMDRYDPMDVAYMGSRLRAEGVLREQMDAHRLQLRCIFRDANGVMA